MDGEGFKKTYIKENKNRGGIHQPLYGTWVELHAETRCRKVYDGEESE